MAITVEGRKSKGPGGETAPAGQVFVLKDGVRLLRPESNPTPELGGGGGGESRLGGGGGAEALVASQKSDSEALIRQQEQRGEQQFQAAQQRSQQALESFRSTIAGLERPEDISKRIQEEEGVTGIRESTKGLRQSIASAQGQLGELPGAVRQSLRGALVTEGQRTRLIAKESIPITKELEVLSRTLGVESANLSEAMSAAITQTQFAIQGQERDLEPSRLNIQQVAQLNQQRLALFSDAAARELTAFTTQRESELDVLLDKLQNDRTLAATEMENAFTLARDAAAFEQAKEELQLRSQLIREESREENKLLSAREIALRLTKAPSGGLKGLGETEEFSSLIQGVNDVFNQNIGTNNAVNIQIYRQEKLRLAAQGVSGDDFDNEFSSFLSATDRISLGIGSTANVSQLIGNTGVPTFDES